MTPHIVAVHPVLAGLTDADLSNWSCSVHEVITAFPSTFLPLAIANNVTGEGEYAFADGSHGVPYILARGNALQAVGLNILKTGPATAPVPSDITYEITYGNTGAADALNTVITDHVPAGTTFVSADNGGTFAAGDVTWNIGTLAHGTSGLTVHFTVHITAAGAITNTGYSIAATDVTPVVGPDVVTNGGGPVPTPTAVPPRGRRPDTLLLDARPAGPGSHRGRSGDDAPLIAPVFDGIKGSGSGRSPFHCCPVTSRPPDTTTSRLPARLAHVHAGPRAHPSRLPRDRGAAGPGARAGQFLSRFRARFLERDVRARPRVGWDVIFPTSGSKISARSRRWRC